MRDFFILNAFLLILRSREAASRRMGRASNVANRRADLKRRTALALAPAGTNLTSLFRRDGDWAVRAFNIGMVAFAAFAVATAKAGAPQGYEKFYDAPTRVNMGGRPVTADIALYADMTAAARRDLRIALVTDVTTFIEETERDLENWIRTRRDECGERWMAGEPVIGFPAGAIRFALDLEYEYWNCGWNGEGRPWRAARETGSIDATLIPEVIDGRLQARLGNLTIDQRTGINRYLPLEFVTRRILERELANLNENPKFFRAPQPFHREGFVYEAIDADRENGRVIITARYAATGDAATLDRLTQALLEDGIVSER